MCTAFHPETAACISPPLVMMQLTWSDGNSNSCMCTVTITFGRRNGSPYKKQLKTVTMDLVIAFWVLNYVITYSEKKSYKLKKNASVKNAYPSKG